MFRPDRLLVRTYSCTAVPVPVPVPVAGIYYCTSNCAYACMRAVQNCMLARERAIYILWAFRLPVQAVEIATEPIKNNRSMFRPDRLILRTDYR